MREQQEEMERLKGALTKSKSPIITAAKAVRAKNVSISAPTSAAQQLNVDGPILSRNVIRNLAFNATPMNVRLYDETGTRNQIPASRKHIFDKSNLSCGVHPQSGSNTFHRSDGPGNIIRLAVSNPPFDKKRHLSPNNCSRAVSILNKRKNAVEGTKTFARTLPIKQMINKPDGSSKFCRGGLKQIRALKAVSIELATFQMTPVLILFLISDCLLHHMVSYIFFTITELLKFYTTFKIYDHLINFKLFIRLRITLNSLRRNGKFVP